MLVVVFDYMYRYTDLRKTIEITWHSTLLT